MGGWGGYFPASSTLTGECEPTNGAEGRLSDELSSSGPKAGTPVHSQYCSAVCTAGCSHIRLELTLYVAGGLEEGRGPAGQGWAHGRHALERQSPRQQCATAPHLIKAHHVAPVWAVCQAAADLGGALRIQALMEMSQSVQLLLQWKHCQPITPLQTLKPPCIRIQFPHRGAADPRAFHIIWVQARAPSGGWPPPALYWLLPPVHSGIAAAHVFHPVPAA